LNREVLLSAIAAMDRNEPFALLTVVDAEGSTPGKPGQQMILFADGRQEGTVGGGALERRAARDAAAMLREGRGGVLEYSLDAASIESIGAVCGGRATLSVALSLPAAWVLICGGGHVAFALARILRELGILYTIADGRAEVCAESRYPDALEIVREPPPRFVRGARLERYTHVVVLTHDHALDAETLRALAEKRFPRYVGMIGSRTKWQEVALRLRESGVEEAWLAGVRCPIGLPIGAKTPAQIAVSIASEIISQMNAGSRPSLRDGSGTEE